MRRRIVMLLVFLLGGAVVNVAVAWGCAVWHGHSSHFTVSTGVPTCVGFGRAMLSPDYTWWFIANRTTGAFLIGSYVDFVDVGHYYVEKGQPELTLPSWSLSVIPQYDPTLRSRQRQVLFAAGWPCTSLFVELRGEHVTGLHVHRVSGFVWGPTSSLDPPPAIPFRPIWPGFAANTIFYAPLFATLCFLIRVGYRNPHVVRIRQVLVGVHDALMFRRVIRRRRGLCPKCAYPMGDSPVCTECGEPLPKREAAT